MAAGTRGSDYTGRLIALRMRRYKRYLDVQIPYRWNLRRLKPGYTLDIGCGIGRNLKHLGGSGVGIDHNPDSVRAARSFGLAAYSPEDFLASEHCREAGYDSILLSHVAEHMRMEESAGLLRPYIPLLKNEGRLIIFTPQEAGQKSDPTHVEFMDFEKLRTLARGIGFSVIMEYSFPLPRPFGRFFVYNEFVSVSRRSAE